MASSLHQEALENALRVLKKEKEIRAVAVINRCLRDARRRVAEYQEKLIKENPDLCGSDRR